MTAWALEDAQGRPKGHHCGLQARSENLIQQPHLDRATVSAQQCNGWMVGITRMLYYIYIILYILFIIENIGLSYFIIALLSLIIFYHCIELCIVPWKIMSATHGYHEATTEIMAMATAPVSKIRVFTAATLGTSMLSTTVVPNAPCTELSFSYATMGCQPCEISTNQSTSRLSRGRTCRSTSELIGSQALSQTSQHPVPATCSYQLPVCTCHSSKVLLVASVVVCACSC